MVQNVQTAEDTQYLGYCVGAVRYMHFIQDVFIENVYQKDWYANIYGRTASQPWAPFNAFITEGIPDWVGLSVQGHSNYTITHTVFDYINTTGYARQTTFLDSGLMDVDGLGGASGWLINTGESFSVLDLSNSQHMPNNMWVIVSAGTDPNSTGNAAVYSSSNNYGGSTPGPSWSNSSMSINTGDAFIIFTKNPMIITPAPDWRRNFIRMKLEDIPFQWIILNSGTGWDSIDPMDTPSLVEEYFTSFGWNENLYIQETNIGGMVESPHGIIRHITGMSTYNITDEYISQAIHQGWRMAFTMTEQKTMKEFIEEFATNTKLYPKYNSQNKFTLNPIKSFWNMSDVKHKIYASDVQKINFQLSNIEDIKDRLTVLYHYDYGNNKFNKEVGPEISVYNSSSGQYVDFPSLGGSFGVINSLYMMGPDGDEFEYNPERDYNLDEESLKEQFEAKYIRDGFTAESFHKYKLMDMCNQHLIIKLELSTKFLNLEAGDVVYISQLSDETAFGYKYWTYEVKGGQLMYPFYMITEVKKKSTKVDIIARRLHRLEYGVPLWYIEGLNNDENYIPPLTEAEIEGAIDDGQIYNGNGDNVTENYQITTEPPPDESDYLSTNWENDDDFLHYAHPDSIRLNVTQIPYSWEYPQGMTWQAEVAESDHHMQGFHSWNPIETDSFQIVTVTGGTTNNYNGYVEVHTRGDNTDAVKKYGKLRLTFENGEIVYAWFEQNFDVDGTWDELGLGDVTGDGTVNILDIVAMVQLVLAGETIENYPMADVTQDGVINILDIVNTVQYVLGNLTED
jgi:hypothetical protein